MKPKPQLPQNVHIVGNRKSLHELLEEREERIMTENADKRVREAKHRLRHFIIFSDMKDEKEKQRLLKYFSHRLSTFFAIVNEAVKDKKRFTKDMTLQAQKAREDPKLCTRQDQALMRALKSHNPHLAEKKAKK